MDDWKELQSDCYLYSARHGLKGHSQLMRRSLIYFLRQHPLKKKKKKLVLKRNVRAFPYSPDNQKGLLGGPLKINVKHTPPPPPSHTHLPAPSLVSALLL